MTADPFSPHIEAVARAMWGEPNARLSTRLELRWGSRGSRVADLEKGVWSDHESGEGGGVLALVAKERGCKNGDAVRYLRDDLGLDIPDDRAPLQQPKRKIIATYDYRSETGELLFQVVRFEPKDFRQRRPDPEAADGWNWSVKGVRQVPYRLGELVEAIAQDATVFIVEGEKDVDTLARACLPATCNAGGAGKWPDGLGAFFRGADVVIIPDNDEAGRNHSSVVGAALDGIAKTVRVLDLPGIGPKGDVSEWLANGGSPAELYLLAEKSSRPWNSKRPDSRFSAVFWGDLDAQVFRERPLVKGLVDQGDAAMIYGESGCGKSFLAVDMGMAIARGEPFLGMKTVQGPVVYQAGEGGRGLLKRLRAYKDHHQVRGDVPFVLLPDKVNLFAHDGDADAFVQECVGLKSYMRGLSAVVIDTFSAASAGANENASEDMGRMLDAGYRINKATGAAVVWVHHKNAQGLRERGHTSFRANIETAVEVTKDPETKTNELRLVKRKDGEDGLRLGFELYPVEIGTDDDGDPITSCVVRPAQVGSEQAGKRYRLPDRQHNFLSYLDEAIGRYGAIMPVTDPAIPPGTHGVEWQHFRMLYSAGQGVTRDDNALRQALHREGDALLRKRLIGKHNPYIWITPAGAAMLGIGP